jgi:hypothetical protein
LRIASLNVQNLFQRAKALKRFKDGSRLYICGKVPLDKCGLCAQLGVSSSSSSP